MNKLRVNQFEIKCRKTGSQLLNRENEHVYEIFSKSTGKKVADRTFSTKRYASEWLSVAVRKANEIIDKRNKDNDKE